MFAVLTCLQELEVVRSKSCNNYGIRKLELMASAQLLLLSTVYVPSISVYLFENQERGTSSTPRRSVKFMDFLLGVHGHVPVGGTSEPPFTNKIQWQLHFL